jgi:hypothetical protein
MRCGLLMWWQEGIGPIGVQDGADMNPSMGDQRTHRVESDERRHAPDQITGARLRQLARAKLAITGVVGSRHHQRCEQCHHPDRDRAEEVLRK